MDGLKGHRNVGGIRASIYNAFPIELPCPRLLYARVRHHQRMKFPLSI